MADPDIQEKQDENSDEDGDDSIHNLGSFLLSIGKTKCKDNIKK